MKKKILALLGVLGVSMLLVSEAKAYHLLGWWHGGSNKILRYNQSQSKHSLQIAHADIHWNNQVKGTIQRHDLKPNVYIQDYNDPKSGTGGVTYAYLGLIAVNDHWMIKSRHGQGREYSFNIMTHEFGHALGLAHSSYGNVMYAYFNPVKIENVPTADDRNGLIASKRRW